MLQSLKPVQTVLKSITTQVTRRGDTSGCVHILQNPGSQMSNEKQKTGQRNIRFEKNE